MLCETLVEMRKNSGRTQEQIAKRLGVSTKTWRHYEQGVNDIPATKLFLAISYCHYDFLAVLANFMPRSQLIKIQKSETIKSKQNCTIEKNDPTAVD
ncbi:MAG: DNA-binding XRE family transcriptional regulator [Phenylobacterium sp.]|jgi:DNA-binding XRE family transcriptional regulator